MNPTYRKDVDRNHGQPFKKAPAIGGNRLQTTSDGMQTCETEDLTPPLFFQSMKLLTKPYKIGIDVNN